MQKTYFHFILRLFNQKKSIPPSATRRQDGNKKMGSWKLVASPTSLLAPVFLFLGCFLETVFPGYFKFGPAVIAGNDFSFFGIGSQGNIGPTNRTLRHISPPYFFYGTSQRMVKGGIIEQ
jgi:hypothetical protein